MSFSLKGESGIYKLRFLLFLLVWATILEIMSLTYFVSTHQFKFEFYITLIMLLITSSILILIVYRMKKEVEKAR